MESLQGLHVELQIIQSALRDLKRSLYRNRPLTRIMIREHVEEIIQHVECAVQELKEVVEQLPPCPVDPDIPF